jgi:hypothetical protein
MNGALWSLYLQLLASSPTSSAPVTCVGCWYEQHPREAFPGDRVSSSLCAMHIFHLPPEVKCPDSLLEVAA